MCWKIGLYVHDRVIDYWTPLNYWVLSPNSVGLHNL